MGVEMQILALAAIGMLGVSPYALTVPAPCAVRGVWTVESVIVDGKAEPLGKGHNMMIVTATHFAWVRQEPGPSSLRSLADSLAAYRSGGFGGGTYRVTDSTFIQHIEYFYNPIHVGRENTASCHVAGNRWQHNFEWPVFEHGRETRRARVEEVLRRIE